MQKNKTIAILFSFVVLLTFLATIQFALAQSEKGMEMSQKHKSKVANVVQELKELADKDQNIGEEVRVVAQEQEESNERATEAMEKVETRGGFKTFLIGTDYKNIGALRSEVVTTKNHINRLTKARDRATSEEVKAVLDAQIAELEEVNTNAETFIQENEDKFSLFGWFARIFN